MKVPIKSYFVIAAMLLACVKTQAETFPADNSHKPVWHIGIELAGGSVPGSNPFLKGFNLDDKSINSCLGGNIRTGFSFSPDSREGILYKGVYQGLGLGVTSYFSNSLLGTPVSVFAYQGAPIVHFNDRLWLGYEWQFGAAFGWKHYDAENNTANVAVSTCVTAHMGVSLKVHYKLSDNFEIWAGAEAKHYSNGNTSWPNSGVNSIGGNVGLTYTINPYAGNGFSDKTLEREADRHVWFYDITVFGAWRRRVIKPGNTDEYKLCPGLFPVAGVQVSPMFKVNRWFAAGPAVDVQWDQSAGLAPYLADGIPGDELKFYRPPFGKQISAGLSVHAELIMPVFTVNAGMGYDFVNPVGNKHFYQMLTLKTFITRHIYLNTGYRLGNFNDPQNLMLGVGVRL